MVEVTARRQRNSFEIFFNCSFASQLGFEDGKSFVQQIFYKLF